MGGVLRQRTDSIAVDPVCTLCTVFLSIAAAQTQDEGEVPRQRTDSIAVDRICTLGVVFQCSSGRAIDLHADPQRHPKPPIPAAQSLYSAQLRECRRKVAGGFLRTRENSIAVD